MKAQYLFFLTFFILACGGLSIKQQKAYNNQVELNVAQYLKGVETYIKAGKDVQNWKDRKVILMKMPEYQDTTSFAFRYAGGFKGYIDSVEVSYTKMKNILSKNYEGVEYEAGMKSLKFDLYLLKEAEQRIEFTQLHANQALKGSYFRIGDKPPADK